VEYQSHHRTFEYPKMPDVRDYVSKGTYQPSAGPVIERSTGQERYSAPAVPNRPAEYARLQPRPYGDSKWTYAQPAARRITPSGSPASDPPRAASRQSGTQTPPSESPRAPDPTTRRTTGALLSMRVPAHLIARFLALAQRNTARRIETLGLLLGTERLQYGRIPQLVVEVLVVPKQTGTGDTCAMLQEEEVLAVSLERGLDCLGWVRSP
jgi:hypothetical protein